MKGISSPAARVWSVEVEFQRDDAGLDFPNGYRFVEGLNLIYIPDVKKEDARIP